MLKDSRIKYLVISKSLRYFLLNCDFDIVREMTQEFRGRFVSGFILHNGKERKKKTSTVSFVMSINGRRGGGDIGVPRA